MARDHRQVSQPIPPIEHFLAWFGEAEAAGMPLFEAAALATADARGHPSVRMVLVRDVSDGGLCFFTSYESRKAKELQANPHAALLFHWTTMERQVRAEGMVERLTAEESDAYFAQRPRESKIAAVASPQSRPIASHEALLQEHRRLAEQFADADIPRPEHWGGYRLRPDHWEFWTGREHRLHHRLVYQREGEGWTTTLLGP